MFYSVGTTSSITNVIVWHFVIILLSYTQIDDPGDDPVGDIVNKTNCKIQPYMIFLNIVRNYLVLISHTSGQLIKSLKITKIMFYLDLFQKNWMSILYWQKTYVAEMLQQLSVVEYIFNSFCIGGILCNADITMFWQSSSKFILMHNCMDHEHS